MHTEARCDIALSDIPAGFVLSQPVQNNTGVLLLAANQAVTAEQLAQLRRRGVKTLALHADDRDRIHQSTRPVVPVTSKREKKPLPKLDQLWNSNDPLRSRLTDRFGEDTCPRRQQRITSLVQSTASSLIVIGKLLLCDSLQATLPLKEVSQSLAEVLIEDVDQALGCLLRPTGNFDLPTRITHLAGLSMAMSIELNMSAASTMEIGLAAILHDLSLLKMDPRLRSSDSTLSPPQWEEYIQHPIESQRMVESIELPHAVRLAVAQVHEQLDGSGFPRGLTEPRIHSYAKLINVADAYLRVIGPGPGRPPVVQHDAIGVLLHTQRRRLFDPWILRSLINIVTLFPLGCDVELSDGRTARVIRRPQKGFGEPIVRIDSPASDASPGQVLPLESSGLKIARPVSDSHIGQLRLSREVMETTVWHPSNF